jgi:hypothetical protein
MEIGIVNKKEKIKVEYLNLMSTDATNIENLTIFLCYLFVAPIKATVICTILFNTVRNSKLSGLILFSFMVPLQIGLSRVFGSLK